jgi:hypothetical protein
VKRALAFTPPASSWVSEEGRAMPETRDLPADRALRYGEGTTRIQGFGVSQPSG